MATLKKKQEDFRKSRKFHTMKKKLEQLTTLCDVDAFLLCFEHGNTDIPSYSWPEDQRNCFSLIHKYRRTTLVEEPNKNKNKNKRKRSCDSTTTASTSPSSSFKKMKMMFETHPQNRGFQMGDFPCSEGFGPDEVRGVLDRIDRNRMAVEERIQFLKLNQSLKAEKSYPMFGISDEEKSVDTMMMMSSGLLESVVFQSGALAETWGKLDMAEEATNERAKLEEFSEMKLLGYGDADNHHQWSSDFGISLEELDFINY